MTDSPKFAELTVGSVIAERSYHLTRDSLVRYAGASGDFNPIHYRDDVAQEVGLQGVLAHGMLTMGVATTPVAEWLGDAGVILDAQARFTRPVWVDAESGATVEVKIAVNALDPDARTAQFKIDTYFEGKTVLVKALVLVQFFETDSPRQVSN
ncbi:MaoC/PaaZ C-terminal domain-containing protein [Canibacter zhoujuaniae]|uniref:MaoC/PaaZ C-terminal domain-containing protein n=1 Tax=Canibacter zhoujuaniae TaxID=2708343 RepID=UPI00141FE841|nr:MaoC/PaaZ C-terminal domain-containing protein [Canibacter zhoujuaniae]